MIKTDCIIELMSIQANVKLAHWQADSCTNEHKALGDLYDSLDGLVDNFAELVLGKNGDRKIKVSNITLVDEVDHCDLVCGAIKALGHIRSDCKQGDDDDLLNILADISAALNKAKYLLQL